MAEEPALSWRKTLKRRLIVAAVAMALWTAAIEARLVYLQVVHHADLSARAERQQKRTISAPAMRGEILDRRGRVLAYSVDAESVYAVPSDIEKPQAAVAALCSALEDCTAKDRETLTERFSRQSPFAYVRRQVTPGQARRIRALALEGTGFMKESRRFYPNKELGAHLLGYVGTDSTGLHGIEAAYDGLIKGKSGTVLVQTDARRHVFSRLEKPPTTGATLELTIDQYLQHIAERELRAGVDTSSAAGGSAVILDPWTGEILAMANWPTFNPNAFRQAPEDARRNRAVQDLYEPGSTFKVITASAALEEKVIHPDDPVDVSAGMIRFGSRVINDDHHYGVLTFSGVVAKSSNVGTIKVGLQLGPERFGAYVRRFGFGRATSPDFPGESPGIVWNPAKLNDSALASMLIGYQVAVTPLQMATAMSAVANGGELVQPRIVRAVIRDGLRVPVPRKVMRRAISAETAAALTRMLEEVVAEGTATRAHIDGHTVAGKTGTAQKLVNGRYSTTQHIASFVGFLPSHKPVFTVIVVIDSPSGSYGGLVAAPVFQKIAVAALRHYGVPPTVNAPPPLLVARRLEQPEQQTAGPGDAPTIATLNPSDALRGGPSTGFGTGLSTGLRGNPAALADNDTGARVPAFPDLRGLSARDAIRALARIGLTARVHGAGLVVAQQPEPGAVLDGRTTCELWLERQLPDAPRAGHVDAGRGRSSRRVATGTQP